MMKEEKEVKKERRTESGLSLDRLEVAIARMLSRQHGFEVIVKCTSPKEVK
ncbi:hypothetical protein [Vagococcus fluvialis]|uniref:hypothetical protein n=1 Tax=Vagococcus fluvialis TaxID=2738 RepID=UPI001D0B0892|nr:hypothetical protein [Vagococcus fluvialis]UDM74010.1 hypothetical protein K5K99_14070 [Vagococcus fluvialis]